MHVSPNVKNVDRGGELRTDVEHVVVAETNMPNSMIEEHLIDPFMDEMFELDLDFDPGQWGFLDVDSAASHRCFTQLQNLDDKFIGFLNHIGRHLPELINGV
jgi:hypothetical protein